MTDILALLGLILLLLGVVISQVWLGIALFRVGRDLRAFCDTVLAVAEKLKEPR